MAFEQMQNEDKDGSLSATMWDLSYLQVDGGLLTPSEYTQLFTKHEFEQVTCTLTQDWNDYDIIFAKKGNFSCRPKMFFVSHLRGNNFSKWKPKCRYAKCFDQTNNELLKR